MQGSADRIAHVQPHGMFERFVQQTLTTANHTEWLADAASFFGRDVDAQTIALWMERFEQMFRQRTAQEREEAISAAGGACTICKTIDEWLVNPQAVSAGMVMEVDDAQYGRMKQPGVQVKLRRAPGRMATALDDKESLICT